MCRGLTAICLRCDRGQRYCSPACALEARRRSMSEANKRYAATLKGGLARAEASRNYRSRMNKVIDHPGGPPMVCSPRARWPLKSRPRRTASHRQQSLRRQPGIAAGAAAAAQTSFAGTFGAAGLLEASPNGTDKEAAVTIPPDTEAQILRYYHVEKWRIGTIARQLHLHYDTVARVLAQAGLPRHGPPPRRSKADWYFWYHAASWAPGAHGQVGQKPGGCPAPLKKLSVNAATMEAPAISGISSPATGRAQKPKPICACTPCPESRRKSTGATSAISPSAGPSVH
jgi:hypothetical protein